MATKLKRVQALTAQTPSIGRLDAATRRSESGERGRKPPEREPVAFSFNVADIKNMTLTLTSKGIVVTPPRPKQFVVELSFEVTEAKPGR